MDGFGAISKSDGDINALFSLAKVPGAKLECAKRKLCVSVTHISCRTTQEIAKVQPERASALRSENPFLSSDEESSII